MSIPKRPAKRTIKSDLKRVDRHRISASEYEDAPEITNEMLDRAEIVKVVQAGVAAAKKLKARAKA